MIQDIVLSSGAWWDLYTASGFAPGTKLLVYNKGSSTAFFWEGSSASGLTLSQGVPVLSDAHVIDQNGVTGCWVASLATVRLCVQEYVE